MDKHLYTDDCLCFRCSMVRVGVDEKDVEDRINPEVPSNVIYADFKNKKPAVSATV